MSQNEPVDELVPFNTTLETRIYLSDYNSIANLILWYIDPLVRRSERVEFPQRVALQIRNGATLKLLTLGVGYHRILGRVTKSVLYYRRRYISQ